MSIRFQFLGTGTSVGVPMIGCSCAVCTSCDPRDRRRRCAVYVRTPRAAFVIDTPPEFRLQCLDAGIARLDAVVFTHMHVDHTAGFDDIRRFNTINGDTSMKAYGAPETLAALRAMFPYVTAESNAQGLFRPMIEFTPVEAPFVIGDAKLTPLPVEHGGVRTNGYLIECGGRRAAYFSDCVSIPSEVLRKIRGVDMMAVDCLRRRPHPTHMCLDGALAALAAAQAKRGFLTHLCHDVSHVALEAELPPGVRPAYDGLVVNL